MAEFQEPNGILKVCDPYIITVMPKLKVLTFIKDYKWISLIGGGCKILGEIEANEEVSAAINLMRHLHANQILF